VKECGTLDVRLIVPPGAPIARLYPHYAQEWVEPRIPDPEEDPVRGAWLRHMSEGPSDLLADGTFSVRPHGEGPVMLWLDFRPSGWEPDIGWDGILESDLAVGLGKATVPDRTFVHREFDLRDLYPGGVDVSVRVGDAPKADLRVTLCVAETVDELHVRGLETMRSGRRYSGGVTAITASDGHARFPQMFAGEWTCTVRPADRTWIFVSRDPVVVRASEETTAAVEFALARHEIRFTKSDPTSISLEHPEASPTSLDNTRIRWFQRTELGPRAYGRARTDRDGAVSLELPEGVYDFEVDDPPLESRPGDRELDHTHRLSRVRWTADSATSDAVRLRVR